MKTITLVVCLLLVAGMASAGIVKTQRETKVADAVYTIGSVCEATEQELLRKYNDVKDDITNYPADFDISDKTILSGLDTLVTDAITALQAVKVYIDGNIPVER